jgi:DNA-binding CsgD family transcriptional regulator
MCSALQMKSKNNEWYQLIDAIYEMVTTPENIRVVLELLAQYTNAIEVCLKLVTKPDFEITSIIPELSDSEWFMTIRDDLKEQYNDVLEQTIYLTNDKHHFLSVILEENNVKKFILCFLSKPNEKLRYDHEIFDQIFGHLKKVLNLQKFTQRTVLKINLENYLLNSLTMAVLLVDKGGKVLYQNNKALDLLKSDECLLQKSHDGILMNGSSLAELQNVIQKVILTTTSEVFLFQQNKKLFVFPVQTNPKLTHEQLAIIIISETEKLSGLFQIIGNIYGLSPTELKIVSSLLENKSLENYANLANVSMNTVRSQLKSIFDKTNTHKQSELVSLINSLLIPLDI